jgi:hypothetical protein
LEGYILKARPAVLLVCCITVLVLISGCTINGTPEDKTPTAAPSNGNTTTIAPTAAPTFAPTPVPEPAPISVSGTGSAEAVKIHLEQGLSIFTINHPDNGVFEIWLSDRVKKLDRLVYKDGGFWGRKAVGITAADDYYLIVTAHGVWTVNIDQPRPYVAYSVPTSFSGSGQQVTDFFILKNGVTTFNMTHDGWMDFNVWLFASNGTKVERLASSYGPYDGSITVNITNGGIYLLDVQADGHWNVAISQ